jgi:hypothetical protein
MHFVPDVKTRVHTVAVPRYDRLGWSLSRIEPGVRRETAGDYLRSAGIALRAPSGWGRKTPAKAALTP